MDSPCCIRLDIPLATSQHRCNGASAPFVPTYPQVFSVVVSGSMPDYKTMFDARFDKSEVPAEVFLAGHFRCLIPPCYATAPPATSPSSSPKQPELIKYSLGSDMLKVEFLNVTTVFTVVSRANGILLRTPVHLQESFLLPQQKLKFLSCRVILRSSSGGDSCGRYSRGRQGSHTGTVGTIGADWSVA